MQKHVYQKRERDVDELKQHLIETWSTTSRASLVKRLVNVEIVLRCVSKPFSITIVTMAVFCITSERKRAIGQKSLFCHTPAFGAPLSGPSRIIAK